MAEVKRRERREKGSVFEREGKRDGERKMGSDSGGKGKCWPSIVTGGDVSYRIMVGRNH